MKILGGSEAEMKAVLAEVSNIWAKNGAKMSKLAEVRRK
jgi:hypothetical protein